MTQDEVRVYEGLTYMIKSHLLTLDKYKLENECYSYLYEVISRRIKEDLKDLNELVIKELKIG